MKHFEFSRLPSRGLLLTLLFASFALWLNIWLAKHQQDAEESAPKSTLYGLTWKAENTSVWTISGQQQSHLTAEKIDFQRQQNRMNIQSIALEYQDTSTDSRAELSADSGKLENGHLLQLQNNVTITQTSPQISQITTKSLNFDLESGKAHSNQKITMTQPDITTTANGMQLNTKSGLLELLSQVTTTYNRADEQ